MYHHIKTLISSIIPKPEQSLNTIWIDKKLLLNNLALLKKLNHNNPVFPVLKSNAYGHGLKEVSTILRDSDVPFICVDSYPEYQIVKEYARKKVLIMGETFPENYSFYDPKRATPVVYTINTLKALIQTEKKRTIHLFLNTGMNRE
jgi:alanine racemase